MYINWKLGDTGPVEKKKCKFADDKEVETGGDEITGTNNFPEF